MTKIQDRTENNVVCSVHPLVAEKTLELCDGDKTRVFWISPYETLIVNSGRKYVGYALWANQ